MVYNSSVCIISAQQIQGEISQVVLELRMAEKSRAPAGVSSLGSLLCHCSCHW